MLSPRSRLDALSWPQVKAALNREGSTVVWPFGACEQHGPQLPLTTDALFAERILQVVLEQLPSELPIWALPVQAIGFSPEHAGFPGTLSLSADLLIRLLEEVGSQLADAGAQLFGRRIGEGHHQQGLEGVVGLRDQPQAEMRQSKGFAGASAGLKQADPRAEGVGVGIEALSHQRSLIGPSLKTSVNFHEAAGESCELDWVQSHPRTEDDLSEGLKNPRFFWAC